MYHIKLESYIPEPKPATVDRIVAAHYYAAWKYGSAGLHGGFNDLAKDYPDRTPLMGYYDEENPEVCDWEIKWAVEHGVNCFIHCWYRRKYNEKHPVTVEDLRCGHGLHEALFNARFQNFIKFAIMFEASPMWGSTDEEDLLENLIPFWTETYFKRGNYLLIDNKPVLFTYKLSGECFRSAESQKAAFDRCREYAKKAGFDGMVFAMCDKNVPYEEAMARGYDFIFSYTSGFKAPYDNYTDEEDIIRQQCEIFAKRLEIDNERFIPTVSCFWDTTPRHTEAWASQGFRYHIDPRRWYLSPENFRRLVARMKAMADAQPEGSWARRIMMIDNWNEWDEGHFIAPSHKFGFQYLQAIREEMTARDNLPDYRTPQDQGFTGYNRSWVTPDFSQGKED